MKNKLIAYMMTLVLGCCGFFFTPNPAQAEQITVSGKSCCQEQPIVIDPIVIDNQGELITVESLTININCCLSACLKPCAGIPDGSFIDFETLPSGETPIDNSELVEAYNDGESTLTFGFDIDDDLNIDLNARLESRLESGNKFAYTHQGNRDLDRTKDHEGGDWLVRAPRSAEIPQGVSFNLYNGDTFLVIYDGQLSNSVSGQLWDLDNAEQYKVEALDESGEIIQTFTTPAIPDGEGSKTFSGLPETFYFDSLPRPVKTLRFSGFKAKGGNGGFAFDNFSAKYVCPEILNNSEQQ